ncbi:MAG: hypothetical protein ACI92G_000363 [Candidatus Pelagisphaera sp.]|jgi:hypothetical protein
MEKSHHPVFAAIPAALAALAYSLTCLAYAWRFNRFSCKTFSFLWEENGLSEKFAGNIESTMIGLLLVSAVCIWIPRIRWIALIGATVMLSEMLSETFMPSAKYPMLYWAEWSLRYSTPLIAILLFQMTDKGKLWSIRLMRLAIAMVFVGHGIKALYADPRFIDYLLVTFRRIGVKVSEDQAVTLLLIIGTLDILLAAHLLFRKLDRNRGVLIWITAWGLITAFSRVTYGGIGNWHEVLIRSSHFLIPIALLVAYRIGPTKRPERST